MNAATVIGISAVVLYSAGLLAAITAHAEDEPFKSGKWDIVATAPNGTTVSRTKCLSSENSLPTMEHRLSVTHPYPCTIDKPERSGGTLSWSATCIAGEITIEEKLIGHYTGETLDGVYTVRSTKAGGSPIETSQPLTGRYLGPCDDK